MNNFKLQINFAGTFFLVWKQLFIHLKSKKKEENMNNKLHGCNFTCKVINTQSSSHLSNIM